MRQRGFILTKTPTQEIKRISLSIALIFGFSGCMKHCKPSDFSEREYNGYALAFFHRPESGSEYEIKFIPICRKEIPIPFDPKALNGKAINDVKGVEIVVNRADFRFALLFEKAIKFELRQSDSLAQEFQSVYVCPVEIDCSEINNNTPWPNRSGTDFFQEKFKFEGGQSIHIKYFVSNTFNINMLKVFDSAAASNSINKTN